jgi:hypothetical protein
MILEFRIYAAYLLFFWITAWILWAQSAELPVDPTAPTPRAIYNSRCNRDPRVYSATFTGYCSLSLTWCLQIFMLWKCRGIKESLGLVKEIRTTAVLCIAVGIIAAGSAVTVRSPLPIDPFFIVNVLWILGISYGSFWIPIMAARTLAKAKLERTASSFHNGDSEGSKQDNSVNERDYFRELLAVVEKCSQTSAAFKAFLCEEFAVENYLFLEAASKLRGSPSSSALSDLWVKFIEIGASYEVNLPASTRKNFKKTLEALLGNPSSAELLIDVLKALSPLEEDIYKMLKNGALLRFKARLNSPEAAEASVPVTAVVPLK